MKAEVTQRTTWFFLKLLMFSVPLLLAMATLLGTAWGIGEAVPPIYQLSFSADAPGAYQPSGGRGAMIAYKVYGALQRQPDVLLLASSRGYHLRAVMFNREPEAFYNASLSAASIDELRDVVEVLAARDALPDVLLLSLDLPDFNGDRVQHRTEEQQFPPIEFWQSNWDQVIDGMRNVGQEWVRDEKPEMWDQLAHNLGSEWPLWGFPVWERDRGFMVDGSQYNGRLLPEIIAQQIRGHEAQLANREGRYEVGASVDEGMIAHVERILRLASEHGTEVIGFLPPYLDSVYTQISTSPDFAYVPLVQDRLAQVFISYGYPLHDYTALASIGAEDAEMYDGWHGGERLMMRVLLALTLAEPEALDAYVDAHVLEQRITTSDNPFYIFVQQHGETQSSE